MEPEPKSKFASYGSDELRELYEKDPALFARISDEAIKEACVGRTPQQTLRLKQLQWVIEGNLRKGKTPLERLRIMENIFYSRVYDDGGLLSELMRGFVSLLHAVNGRHASKVKLPYS